MIAHDASCAQNNQPSPRPCSPLKYQRLLRGWSQQDVVDALCRLCEADGHAHVGLTVDHMRRWENGQNKPIPFYRKQLCILYNLTADKLGFIEHQEGQA